MSKILMILVSMVALAIVVPFAQANTYRDVAVYNQVVDPDTVEPGDIVSLTATLYNGGEIAETFDITVYIDSIEVGTFTVFDLENGFWIYTFKLETAGIPVNTYNVMVWADSGEVIDEIDESNNWCTAQASLFVVPEIPIIGTAGAALAMFVGLAIYMKRKSRI